MRAETASTSGREVYERDVLPTTSPWGAFGRQVVLCAVAAFGKCALEGANATTATGRDAFERAVNAREGGGESGMKRGLVTVCNHVSTFDDPGVLSAMIPWSTFASEARRGGVRWTLCTDEICAKNALREQFFLCGKALAIKRGGGVDQPAMRTAANLLARGDWVHLFPEGRVSKTGTLGPMRRGLAKLLCDVEIAGGEAPIVLPFWHSGMDVIKPYGKWSIAVGERVHVTVGEPLDFRDLTAKCARCEKNARARDHLHAQIMARVESALKELEARNARERAETSP